MSTASTTATSERTPTPLQSSLEAKWGKSSASMRVLNSAAAARTSGGKQWRLRASIRVWMSRPLGSSMGRRD